tara:strand:+ start:2602 stop:3012 length:411 start_codon:yes stop_codon:yes gene_type:complete
MPRMPDELRERLKKYEMNPNDVLWDCHGTPVMYHKYIERIAVIENIQLDPPVIIRNEPNDICVLVSGTLDGHTEWSFGEASKSNNKNAYPFAMAEKRGKDRVILKLAGMAGHVYSDVDVVDPNANDASGAWQNKKA